MEEYEQLLNEYATKVFYEGLDIQDFKEMKRIIYRLDDITQNLKAKLKKYQFGLKNYGLACTEHGRLLTSREDLKPLRQELDDYLQLQLDFFSLTLGFEKNALYIRPTEFVKRNTSLIHLVYTNNQSPRIYKSAYDRFSFCCQFHVDRHPSMEVVDHEQQFHCYGCGISGDAIQYLQEYENISSPSAIHLLKEIYLIDIEDKDIRNQHPLVQKYRKSLLSPEFSALLTVGKTRAETLPDCYRKRYALMKYQQTFRSIERVQEKETIYYKDNLPKQKVYRLPFPNFD